MVADQQALQITINQFNAGTVPPSDVITARTQLEGAQAQLINAGVARAQYEHAIAVLLGRAPAELSIPPGQQIMTVPVTPPGLPSTLLERRPDIAAAERAWPRPMPRSASQVGAYYPQLSLSALGGYAANPITGLFSASNSCGRWGRACRGPCSKGARAVPASPRRAIFMTRSVQTYRQTVLSALQDVENDLSSLRILAQQAVVEAAAVADAQKALQISLNEYQAGTVTYTTVVTAQLTLLSNQETGIDRAAGPAAGQRVAIPGSRRRLQGFRSADRRAAAGEAAFRALKPQLDCRMCKSILR